MSSLRPLPRSLDRFLPTTLPYLPVSTINTYDNQQLSDYAFAIIRYVEAHREITKDQRNYHHYIRYYLKERNLRNAAGQIYALANRFPCVDAERAEMPGSNLTISSSIKITRVSWVILPDPTGLTPDQLLAAIVAHSKVHGSHKLVFEITRITNALALKPLLIAVGQDDFIGYYAMQYANDVVLFECPTRGNAAYIARGEWSKLSHLPKFWLKTFATRVTHAGEGHRWAYRIKSAVQTATRGPLTRLRD